MASKSVCGLVVALVCLSVAHAQDAGVVRDPAAEQRRLATVVARVGGVAITLGQVEAEVHGLPVATQLAYRADPTQLHAFVNEMMRYELLAQGARRAGLGESRQAQQLLEESMVARFMRTQIDEAVTLASVTSADVTAYYQSHPHEFATSELRRASHLLTNTLPEAEVLLDEARALDLGAFRSLAERRSVDDATKLRGGDLRYFDRNGHSPSDETVPVALELVSAAFSLTTVGDMVAAPIAVGNRFSILKLTGVQPGHSTTLEQATNDIRMRIFQQRREAAIDALVNTARSRYHPTSFPQHLGGMNFDESTLDQDIRPDR